MLLHSGSLRNSKKKKGHRNLDKESKLKKGATKTVKGEWDNGNGKVKMGNNRS